MQEEEYNNTSKHRETFLSVLVSVSASFSSICMSSSMFFGSTAISLRKSTRKSRKVTVPTTIVTGSECNKNALNVKSAAEPIMMFGGSPTKVAVPPTFESIASTRRIGVALIESMRAIIIVIGTIKMIVVTLSRIIESTAVSVPSANISNHGLPLVFFAVRIPRYWNIPVRSSTTTIIIIPKRSPSVLKSTAMSASSG